MNALKKNEMYVNHVGINQSRQIKYKIFTDDHISAYDTNIAQFCRKK